MFGGDDPDLLGTMGRALRLARDLDHPRVGSEHLLLALVANRNSVTDILTVWGATQVAVQQAACDAAPAGAGAAADRRALATLGVDLEPLLDISGSAALDRPPAGARRLPLGISAARRRCRQMGPPLGLDAQAAYEASLRLALARRERGHRCQHLALTLVTLDPGVAWVLTAIGVDSEALLADLMLAFPLPRRNPILVAERRLGRRARHRDIVSRYQQLTGRTATAGSAMAKLITS